jgi:hypothetical protein
MTARIWLAAYLTIVAAGIFLAGVLWGLIS